MKPKPTDRAVVMTSRPHVSTMHGDPVPGIWKKHYERLLQLRERMIQDATALYAEAGDAATEVTMHPADASNDTFDRDLAFNLLSIEQNGVNEIDEALIRIREGRYGVCELTGEPIPLRRLEAIPWARYTVEAQVQLERTDEPPHAPPNGTRSARPKTPKSK